ncbi:MAG TPA: hypothetical protein VNF07_06880 [Acidimicrobiales bacterium]|nr:hypothetical protein [Acidimicrobiales bacterium]
MASVIAILRTEHLEITPGRSVETTLTVHNTGTIVEQFTVAVLGEAAGWAGVEPAAISLFPNTQQDVTVTFEAPREWHIPPGSVPFGVKVVPANDPEGSVVEEGTLELAPFQDINAELIPAVATAKRKGKLGMAIDSKSNVPVPVALRGRDPSDTLVINIKPRQLVLQPGTTSFAKLTIVPRKRYLRGPEKQARFKVGVEPEDGEPILLDATLLQKAMLPKGSFAGLALLAALAGWFLVIRPTVKNAAVSAVQPAISSTQKQTASVSQQLTKTQGQVSAVNKKVTAVSTAKAATTTTSAATTTTAAATTTTAATAGNSGSGSGSGSGSTSSTTTSAPTTTTTTTTTTPTTTSASTTTTTTTTLPASGPSLNIGPFNDSLPVVAAPGQVQQASFVIPSGQTFSLTDIIMQNEFAVEGSSLQVGILPPGGKTPSYIFVMSLASTTPEDFSLKTGISFHQGDTLIASVSCAAGGTQPCSTTVLFDGTVNNNT